ncbi:MAG: hypothetical protein ACOY0T_36135 [Myxococcota bacterium]
MRRIGDARRIGRRAATALSLAFGVACGDASHGTIGAGGEGGAPHSAGRGGGGGNIAGNNPGGSSAQGNLGGAASKGGTAGSPGNSGSSATGGSFGMSGGGAFDDAGASGVGGSSGGSPGCSAAQIRKCDDQEPCTEDKLDDACVCTHHTRSDGTTCDDANVCTAGDTCQSGVCSGATLSSEPKIVGELRSYGWAPGLQTLVAFPSATRAVFAREKRLTLVGLDGGAANVLDDVPMSASVSSDSVGAMVWVSRPRTFLIPVLEHHLAVASIDRGFDLFDLAGDKIKLAETYGFGTSGWQVVAVTGAGTRMFACTAYQLQAWSINPTTFFMSPGPTLSLPAGHRCQGLSLAPDGKTLYVATSAGLDRIDVANDGSMTAGTSARQGNLVVDVQATASHVAVFEIRDPVSGSGDVIILARDTLQPLATFAASSDPKGQVPIGFSLLDDSRVLLQTLRVNTNNCFLHEAGVFKLGASLTQLTSRTTLEACQSPYDTPSYHTVANGGFAALEPMHQLVRIDAVDSTMTAIPSPLQGAFERVRAEGGSGVIAYGPGSMHRIDISQAAKPQLLAGGPIAPLTLEHLRLDVSTPEAATLVTVDDPAWGRSTGPLTTLLRANASGIPEISGSLANDDPAGPWFATGGSLYQVSTVGSVNFRVRRFATSAIRNTAAQKLSPDLDQELVTQVPAALDVRTTALIHVDAKTADLVVLERRTNSRDTSSDTPIFSRFSLVGDAYERRVSQPLEMGLPASLATAGGLSVALVSGKLFAIDASGTQQRILSNAPVLERILWLDSDKLVLAAYWGGSNASEGVLVVRTSDFTELARYSTGEPVLSYAEVGTQLVFGARSALFVATPTCTSSR